MNKLNIHQSILLITLAPISIVALAFIIYIIFIQIPNTQKSIVNKINDYTYLVNQTNEYINSTRNFTTFDAQLKLISNDPMINSIHAYDINNKPLSTHSSTNTIEKNNITKLLSKGLFKKSLEKINIPIESTAFIKRKFKYNNSEDEGILYFETNPEYIFLKKYTFAIYGGCILFIIYLCSLYSALYFKRKIAKGINNINDTIIDITEGNLSARANPKLVDKFGPIKSSIEKMAKTIYASESKLHEKIDEANNIMHSYNKEITLSNHKLLKAREQADKANAAKTNFLANISHEIRTPVNGIIGFTELLLSADIQDEHKLCIQNIDDASNKLTRLINDLLDFSKLESGHIQTEITRVDIYDLAAKLHAFYSVNSNNKDVDIYLHIDPKTPRYIFTDEHKLEQIITNLLSNAIKFTSFGYVKIDINSIITDKDNCELYISITDSGVGIAKENQSDIFHKFEQADMTTSRQYGGSGLGLSIASLLAKNINGSITVNSLLGKGSTFILSLITQYESGEFNIDLTNTEVNYYDEDKYHHQHLSNLLIILGCKINKLNIDEAKKLSEGNLICGFRNETSANNFIQSYPENQQTNDKRIAFFSFYNADIYRQFHKKGFQHNSLRTYRLNSLINILDSKETNQNKKEIVAEEHLTAMVIDDNNINVMLLEKYLQKLGVHTISTLSATEAMALLKEVTPDIILTDLHMPKISGIDLACKIRSQYKNLKDTPIIAITADGASSNHDKAINSGIQEVLLKPVSLEIIMQKLTQYTNINFTENIRIDQNMPDHDIQSMLMKQLPVFKSEINTYTKKNDLKQLYQTIHRLVGGLEYCPKHQGLLQKAKIAYKAIINENDNVSNIKEDINNLLVEIEAESD